MAKFNRIPDTIRPTCRSIGRLKDLVVPLVLCLWSHPALALDVPQSLSPLDIVFYTLALTSVAFFSIGMVFTRQYHWLTYSIYGTLMIVLIASLDGSLAYLSGRQWLMSDAPLLIGAITASFGFAHVAYRLEMGHWLYATRNLHLVFAALMALLLPLYFMVPGVFPNLVPLYAILNTGMLIMFTAQIFPPVTWTQFTSRQHLVTILWPVATALVAVGSYAIHFAGPGFTDSTLHLINRLLFLLHLTHLLVFVGISVIEQMRARVNAEQSAANAARAAAETALALEVSERDFARARALASNRSRQLASASHDLKQPIAALRQVVEQHAGTKGGSEVQRLRDAVDYLDQLAGSYLSIGNRAVDEGLHESLEESRDNDQEVAQDSQGRERVAVNVVLDTVAALYHQDADANNVMLQTRPSNLNITTHPLALTRALSNLVANALAHSKCTRILLCARRRATDVRIEVHDNGIGMTDTEKVRQLRYRGEKSSGSGLGLAIVQNQADDQGWTFELHSQSGRGTSAYLYVSAPDGTPS